MCNYGNTITIKHIFNDFTVYNTSKEKYKIGNINCLQQLNSKNVNNIISFLKEINIYNEI